jgi:uncharacterized RDD family membrane protein YckC
MTEDKAEFPVYAGFWRRLCAILIDVVIFLPLFSWFFWMPLDKWGAIFFCALFYFQDSTYNILFLRSFGQTPGMMLMRFKVVRLDLSPLRWREAFLRYSVDIFIGSVSAITMICLFLKASPDAFGASFSRTVLYFDHATSSSSAFSSFRENVDLFWTFSEVVVLLFNEKKRAIHDFIAGTVVVRVGRKREVLFGEKRGPAVLSRQFGVLLAFVFVLILFASFFGRNSATPDLNRINTLVPGVRTGQEFLSSKTLVRGAWIYDVIDSISDPTDPSVFLVAGKNFISSIRYDGTVLENIRLPKSVGNGQWAVESGKARFVAFVGRNACFSLFDLDGKTVWSAPASQKALCSAVGKVLGDSKTQFVVGYEDGTIQLLDGDGRLIWQKWGEYLGDLETADLRGTGHDEIIEISKTGTWMIRDADGNPVTQYSGPVSVRGFSMIPWSGKDGSAVALFPDVDKYMFYSLKTGAPVTEWDAGFKLSRVGLGLKAVWVNWDLKGDRSLAVLSSARSAKSVLTVFDKNGKIQFLEVFYGNRGALAVINGSTSGTQSLLCGVDGKIVEYQRKLSP